MQGNIFITNVEEIHNDYLNKNKYTLVMYDLMSQYSRLT